jgi:hypothetical protein
MTDVSFATLRTANTLRLPLFRNSKGEPAHSKPDGSDWTVQEWLNAVLGEIGETANILKKVRREDMTLEEALPELDKEFADIIVYFDLTLLRMKMPLMFNWDNAGEVAPVTSFDVFARIHKDTMAKKKDAGMVVTKTKSEIFAACIVPFGRIMDAVQQLDGLSITQQNNPELSKSLAIAMNAMVTEVQNNSIAFFCTMCSAAIECGIDLSDAVRHKFNAVSYRVGADVFIADESDTVVNSNGVQLELPEVTAPLPADVKPEGERLQ